jgi:FtsH-binding integral membrane protein
MKSTIIDNNYSDHESLSISVHRYMSRVYGWMCAALVITAFASFATLSSETLLQLIFGNRIAFYVLIGVEFLLVIGITGAINRISAPVAAALFILYSIVNGVTLSVIFAIYTSSSVVSTFLITAVTFGIMSVAGYVTKKDLTKMGSLLFMALIGLVVASLVNMFFQSETLQWICSYAGVIIFIGLTAYDTQKIKNIGSEAISNNLDTSKIAIIGALTLYLDFINLFLYLLRLFGRRK